MSRRLGRASIAAILCAGCLRPPAEFAATPPTPRLDYATAEARIAARKAIEDSIVVKGLGTILMTRGHRTPQVYVLLHGFTDVPTQFEAVGKDLFAGGDNVYIPLLPHHGERAAPIRALGRVRGDELAAFGDSTVDIARGLGDSVIVVGLSAGAVISGWIAQWRPDVRRAVLIAPAIGAGRVSDDASVALTIFASKLPEVTRKEAPVDSEKPEYVQGVSTHGLAEVLKLGRRVRDDAGSKPAGVKDIVILLSVRDQTVSESAALDLAQRWFDRGSAVLVYRFPDAARLPHNVMEVAARGGNPDVAFPVVEALARAATPPSIVELQPVPCRGWRCAVRRWLRGAI